MTEKLERRKRHYRSVFISDIHLGYHHCRADFLLDFLKQTRCDTLYLIGDVIDMWALKNRYYWPKRHNTVLKRLIKIAARGNTKVIYIPGNHDAIARNIAGDKILNIEVHREYVHTMADGRKFLLCHGDEFENAIRHSRLNKMVGDIGYDLLLFCNKAGNRIRKWMGRPYWSAATYLKNRVEKARKTIELYEEAAAAEAAERGLDGVICGHIHQPEIRKINDVLYCNDGDWTESCTALVEDESGWLELMHWSDTQQSLKKDQDDEEKNEPLLVLPRPQVLDTPRKK